MWPKLPMKLGMQLRMYELFEGGNLFQPKLSLLLASSRSVSLPTQQKVNGHFTLLIILQYYYNSIRRV